MTKKSESSTPKVPASQLSLVENGDNFFSAKQLQFIRKKTPKQLVRQRKGKGGQMWDYVDTHTVITALNTSFGGFWSFELLTDDATALDMALKTGFVAVKGRLSIHNPVKNFTSTREQYGRKEVQFTKESKKAGTNMPVDFGNDIKAAASDALKKCASEFGLFGDVFAQNEFREIEVEEKQQAEAEQEQLEKDAQVKSVIAAVKARRDEDNQ